MKEPLKVGDRVRVYDSTCVIIATITEYNGASILWAKDENGVVCDWYVKQCRRLRPKKKRVKKTLVRWIAAYADGKTSVFANDTKEQLINETTHVGRIACVKLTGSYYVEE